jgi:hypothetical protein
MIGAAVSTDRPAFGTLTGAVFCHLVPMHATLSMPATGTVAGWKNQPTTAAS